MPNLPITERGYIVAVGDATLTGGATSEEITVAGINSTDYAFLQSAGGTAQAEFLKAVTGAGKITVSHVDGTGNLAATKLNYIVIRSK